MLIDGDLPDVILITEVIPKNQVSPITHSLIDIDEYNCFTNFNPDDSNLGASGIRGVLIYARNAQRQLIRHIRHKAIRHNNFFPTQTNRNT